MADGRVFQKVYQKTKQDVSKTFRVILPLFTNASGNVVTGLTDYIVNNTQRNKKGEYEMKYIELRSIWMWLVAVCLLTVLTIYIELKPKSKTEEHPYLETTVTDQNDAQELENDKTL